MASNHPLPLPTLLLPPSLHTMTLTSLVAANAAATAAGAGKKAAQVQLQAELAGDEDWDKFMKREGLLVVDVYSEWCGPCIGMVGNLKKIKVEIGGDNLHLAIAKADKIECLKRFRQRSEPTWMFIAGGQLINVVFGADAPRLARTIEAELKNEEQVRQGLMKREPRAPHELTPQEQEKETIRQKFLEDKKAREEAAVQTARTARREARAKRLETHFADICPVLVMPHAQKNIRKVADAVEPMGVIIADKCPLLVGKDGARIIGAEFPGLADTAAQSLLVERPSLALLLKKQPDKEGDVIELTRRALFGDDIEGEEEASKKTVVKELTTEGIPGLFVPLDRHQRAVALDLLFPKMVQSVAEPPAPPEPPHIAMIFGAWQRRAVLAAAAQTPLLKYGFFADANVEQPKLLAKTLDKYEERPEKDYCETLVLMVAVGLAEPALADPSQPPPTGPPDALLSLGPLHVSSDAVQGAAECVMFFPPGYCEPEAKPRTKTKKKKKKRHESKEDTLDSATGEAPPAENGEGEQAEGEGEHPDGEEGEGEAEGEAEGEEDVTLDKATSPPPQTPH